MAVRATTKICAVPIASPTMAAAIASAAKGGVEGEGVLPTSFQPAVSERTLRVPGPMRFRELGKIL